MKKCKFLKAENRNSFLKDNLLLLAANFAIGGFSD